MNDHRRNALMKEYGEVSSNFRLLERTSDSNYWRFCLSQPPLQSRGRAKVSESEISLYHSLGLLPQLGSSRTTSATINYTTSLSGVLPQSSEVSVFPMAVSRIGLVPGLECGSLVLIRRRPANTSPSGAPQERPLKRIIDGCYTDPRMAECLKIIWLLGCWHARTTRDKTVSPSRADHSAYDRCSPLCPAGFWRLTDPDAPEACVAPVSSALLSTVGALLGGMIGAGISIWVERQKSRIERAKFLASLTSVSEIEKARIQAYTELWACFDGISTFRPKEIVNNLPKVQERLQEWYYRGGGGLTIGGVRAG